MTSINNSDENKLIRANGFIDFDENGNIVLVPNMPKQGILTSNNKISKQIETNKVSHQIETTKKRKAYDSYISWGPYECNICHKKFVKKSYCKRHELSHEKMFECNICHNKFMHNNHLNQHMAIHKEKEHQCDICGIKVRYKFNLTRHRKIHMPYRDENGEIKYLL